MNTYSVHEFWHWFQVNIQFLENYDPGTREKLDSIISPWGLGWEIGPGMKEPNSFTISPNGDILKLETTKKIIDRVPKIVNWEFYYCKQAKTNWRIASLIDRKIQIQASDWTYVLLSYPDNKLQIDIKAQNLSNIDQESRALAIDLILTNLLGEQLKMERLDYIEWVNDFENDKCVTELEFLPAHLDRIGNTASQL